MKKNIILNIVLGIGLICTIIAFAMSVNTLDLDWFKYKDISDTFKEVNDPDILRQLDEMYSDCVRDTVIQVLNSVGILAIIATLCLIDIPAIKNYLSMTKEQRAQNKLSAIEQKVQNKAAKEQQKAERTEAEKQKRIEKLQAELEELKKD